MDISFAEIALAFTAGVVTFLSPCLLPLIPGYLAFLAGTDSDPDSISISRPLFFIGGFTIVFVALGAGASAIGQALSDHRDTLNLVAGILVMCFGLFMLFEHKLPPTLLRRVGFADRQQVGSNFGAGLFGVTFALAWSPCIGPTLGAALTLASGAESPWSGATLLAIFSIGLGVPFLAVSLAADKAHQRLAPIRRHMGTIRTVSGVILVVFGLLVATGLLADMSNWLQANLPGFEANL